jgi:hypothetical protein
MDFPRVADAGGDIGLNAVTHEFTDGVVPGTPASVGRAEDMNQVFRELRAVIAWGGGNPDETVFTQVRDNIIAGFYALLDAAGPNGVINGSAIVGQLTGGRPQANLSTSYQYAGVDRFAAKGAGTAVNAGTIQQEAQNLIGSSGYAFSLLGVTITGAGQVMMRYRMESYDARKYKNLAAMMVVLKVYQDTGIVGSGSINYTITVNKPNAADNYSASTNIATSANIPVNNSAGQTISYQFAPGDCSNGLDVIVTASCGAVVTKNFRFTELDIYAGTRVRAFQQIVLAETQSRCLRYFRMMGFACGSGTSGATIAGFAWQFGSPMRIPPVLTLLVTAIQINPNGGVDAQTSSGSAINSSGIGVDGARTNLSGFAGLTGGRAYVINTTNIMACDAEIV